MFFNSDKEKFKQYEKIKFCGEGQFANVFKARDLKSDKIIAIKMIKITSSDETKLGVNRTALREIKFIRELSHKHIITLLDIQCYGSTMSLIFDYMDTDLEVIIKDPSIIFSASHIKAYALMTFLGLEYLHSNWILHRDLKPNNLLVNRDGVLKITDFGLAKKFGSPNRMYSPIVVTRWYRSPELLFGARVYSTAVDMWSMGCILAELLLKVPFLPGESDLDQLTRIFQTLGSPTEETWPNMPLLHDFIQFKQFPGMPLKDIFTAADDDLIELLSALLSINPQNRWSCTKALKSAYFSNHPPPTKCEHLPLPEAVRNAIEENVNGNNGLNQAKKRKATFPLDKGIQPKRLVFDNM